MQTPLSPQGSPAEDSRLEPESVRRLESPSPGSPHVVQRPLCAHGGPKWVLWTQGCMECPVWWWGFVSRRGAPSLNQSTYAIQGALPHPAQRLLGELFA